MTRRPHAVAGLLCLAALTACGAGQDAQTYKPHTYDFVNADQGGIAIRNLAVDGPSDGTGVIAQGGTARATGAFVAQGDGSDQLTGASSTAAAAVTLEQDGRTVQQIPVPALGRASGWAIVLTGTAGRLRVGSFIDLTLVFAKAGRTTLEIPVRSNGTSSGAVDQASPSATASP